MASNATSVPDSDPRIIGSAESSESEENLIVTDTTTKAQPTTKDKAITALKSETGKLSTQAADKARGFVGQGLEKSGEALGNVSKMIGDTATSLDERLGTEYGDYARKAAGAIEDVANKLAAKDADELIDDTRAFVRKSPGVALAGAAIVGFALARLVKAGLDQEKSDRD